MVYNEKTKMSIQKYLKANWETKYKEYYRETVGAWKKENKEHYNEYQRIYMQKKAAYMKESKRLMNICVE
jgi:hypothetical protein